MRSRRLLFYIAALLPTFGQIPQHTTHPPNNGNAIVVYGALGLEPPNLRGRIASWLNERFAWTIGGDVRTNGDAPAYTWWPGYVDFIYLYPYQMWDLQK